MKKYQDKTKNIPWSSLGRESIASTIGKSLLPVGFLPYEPYPLDVGKPIPAIGSDDPSFTEFLMQIFGTAIQAAERKMVTCAHVIDALFEDDKQGSLFEGGKQGHVWARLFRDDTVVYCSYPIKQPIRYIDPRSGTTNRNVDLAVIIMPATNMLGEPYEVPNVKWGDSTNIGVGDPILVGGYPYGTDLFVAPKSNRGIVQPTFHSGIVSAILPALNETETRIIQLSTVVAGGMSGGAVIDPSSGTVLGMVTSGLESRQGESQPVTYALPSEVIAPFVTSLSYNAGDRRWGKEEIVAFGNDDSS